MDDPRAKAVVRAFYDDRCFCVWAAAYVLSFANLGHGVSPSEVVKTIQTQAWARKYHTQAAVLNSLASACGHHNVTWQEVGGGGNV